MPGLHLCQAHIIIESGEFVSPRPVLFCQAQGLVSLGQTDCVPDTSLATSLVSGSVLSGQLMKEIKYFEKLRYCQQDMYYT